MLKSFITSINNFNPKAKLPQSLMPRNKVIGAIETLPLFRLSLLLISLLGTISPIIKSELLLPLSDTAASIRLLNVDGSYSPMALNVNGDNNNQSILAFHQEAKQPILPFDLQKQNKPSFGIVLGGKASEAKLHS